MTIDSKFAYVKRKEVFEPLINTIPEGLNPIVFIEDTREMWTCGTYFSIGYPSIELSEVSGSVKVQIGNSFFLMSTTGESISIRKGDGNRIIINSSALNKVDTEPPLEWDATNKKLLHKDSGVAPGSYGQSTNLGNASVFVIPNITVDATGHIILAENHNIEIRDYVEQLAPSNLMGERNILLSYNEASNNMDTSQVRKANGLTFNDATQKMTVAGGMNSDGPVNINHGDLSVLDGYIIGNLKGDVQGEATPRIHLSLKPEYGGASTKLYGHVKLQDILSTKPDPSSSNENINDTNVVDAIAASPLMVWNAIETAKSYADSILGSNNAMLFKGALEAGVSSPGTHTPMADIGNTYVVTFGNSAYKDSTGYINGVPVEVGDLLICKEATLASDDTNWEEVSKKWTYVQTNTTGVVSGPSSAVIGQLAVFDSVTGKLIKGLPNGSVGQMLVIGDLGIPTWVNKPDRLNHALSFQVKGTEFISFDGYEAKKVNFIAGDNMFITPDTQGNLTLAADPGTDTVNTAGATNLIDTKLFLIGAESQTTSPQTYSNQYVYIGADNCLYSDGKKVSTSDHNHPIYVKLAGDTMTGTLTSASTSGSIVFKGTESNNITNIYTNNGTISGSHTAIRNGLRFNWYDTYWYIGNIRGDSTDSNGFGIANESNKLCLQVTPNNTIAPVFRSTATTGTAPLVVSSNTLVSNLNADLLDGYHQNSFLRTDGANQYVTLTGGNGNNEGYRLVFEVGPLGGWSINSMTLLVVSRHSGTGLLSLVFHTTNQEGTTYAGGVNYYGHNISRGDNVWRLFYNTATKKLRLFWRYYDYSNCQVTILNRTGQTTNVSNGTWYTGIPSDSGAELTTNYNFADIAYIATKLQTPRNLWGKPFDGTADISGNMTGVGDITMSGSIYMNNGQLMRAKNSSGEYEQFFWPRWSDNIMYMNYGSAGFRLRDNASQTAMHINASRNVGIGRDASSNRLHVSGPSQIDGVFTVSSNTFNKQLVLESHSSTAKNQGAGIWFRAATDRPQELVLRHEWYDTFVTGYGLAISRHDSLEAGDSNMFLYNTGRYISKVPTGTKPIDVVSTTLCNNLNADLLDGVHLAGFGGNNGVMRSWKRGHYTTVNQYLGNGNVVTFDPKPTDDTSLSANTTILSLGDSSIRNSQLAFFYESDTIKYRRHLDSGWTSWVTLLHNGNYTGYLDNRYVKKAGDTMTGALTMANGYGIFLQQSSATSTQYVRLQGGSNDYGRIAFGATSENNGWLEIASSDDGTEPIYVRQYTGVFTTIKRTATLLDASGNTTFPGTVTAPTFTGNLNGTATNAKYLGLNPTGRPTSANIAPSSALSKMQVYLATSSMTTAKPSSDGFIMQFNWDNANWGSQLFINDSNTPTLQIRTSNNSATWEGRTWRTVITEDNLSSYGNKLDGRFVNVTGDTMTGALHLANGTRNSAGDDCGFGDCNIGGCLGLQGLNGATGLAFVQQGASWSGGNDYRFVWNGSNMTSNSTAQWNNLNADLLDGWHLDNIRKNVGYSWMAKYKVNNWSRILKIDGYSNVFLAINFSQDSQASNHLYLISTGYNSANIIQLGANNFGGNSGVRIRLTENSATSHNVEIYSTYGYNGATEIGITCNYTKVDGTSTLTTYSSYTAGGGIVKKEITSSYNKIIANIQGNSDTATKLQTARQINGTNFDGTSNITTSYWGTTRSIKIGNTAKNVNGSGNVTWTLAEIGGVAASHTHNYIVSRGNLNAQTGRTQSLGDVYSYNTVSGNTGGPTTYTSVIGFGRGAGGTVEIAGGWTGGMGLWYRALRDTTDNWYGWVKVWDTKNFDPNTKANSNHNHDGSYITKGGNDNNVVLGAGGYKALSDFTLNSNWAASKNTSGYVKFPNGFIIQWGEVYVGANATGYKSFPIAFPTACISVQVTHKTTATNWDKVCVAGNYTRTSCTIANGETVNSMINWVALGY